MEPVWALGLMSGTSLDGVDAACLRTDGKMILERGRGMTVPYPPDLQARTRFFLGQRVPTPEIAELERDLTLFHADVVRQMQEVHPFGLIGFHGHTLFHAPFDAPPKTWQIGDGALLAGEVGIEVISDFRSADVANGGQGAPLVPIFHQAMVQGTIEIPIIIVNIGGVANITWIAKGEPLMACDTGPGGALVDDWVFQKMGMAFDENGSLASQGQVDETLISQWLTHSYFAREAPKSLDRNDFAGILKDVEGLTPADGAATLLELTARTIVGAMSQMQKKAQHLYVTGGGRHNAHLLSRLTRLASCPVDDIYKLGWDGDLLEAHAFAYLAARVKAGLPTSFPTTTGVRTPTVGGRRWKV